MEEARRSLPIKLSILGTSVHTSVLMNSESIRKSDIVHCAVVLVAIDASYLSFTSISQTRERVRWITNGGSKRVLNPFRFLTPYLCE